jgi:peptidoglycan/LPS O-acetylase OafA/YrhL
MELKYRSEIDGLRALAVFPVVFFHAEFELFRGGYVGVDIFFVISGYLITSLILKDIKNNNFSLLNFYERRARRILPALFLIFFFISILSFLFLTRSELSGYFKSLISSLFFYSNFYFWKASPYFESTADSQPLLHTWSLSIEEQFYIFFPLVLILAYQFLKKRRWLIIFFGTFLSLVICHAAALKTGGNLNFYFTLSRGWELGLGALTGYYLFYNGQKKLKSNQNFYSISGLLLILLSIFFFDRKTLHPSLLTLFPTIGTVLIILYANKNSIINKIFSNYFFVKIGLVSYSFYLWHQPLLALSKMYYGEITFLFKILLISISLVFSFITYMYIEKLFRNRKKINTSFFLKLVFSCLIIFLLISVAIINTYNSRSVLSTEYNLAKKISEGHTVFLPNLDKRNFTKFKILTSSKQIDNLIVGSSRIAFIGEKFLNSKSLNLSVGTATIEDQITLTLMGAEKLKFKRIFLAADPWLFNEIQFKPYSDRWKNLKNEYYKSIQIIQKNDPEIKIFDEEEFQRFKLNFGGILDKIYKFLNLRQSKLIAKKIDKADYITFPDGTEKFDTKSINVTGDPIEHFISPYTHSKKKEELFKKFIDYLVKNKKEVVLVMVPFYEESYNLTITQSDLILELEDFFLKLAENKDLKVIGSYNPKILNCNKNEFSDDLHPTESCYLKIFKKESFQ